MQTPANPHTGHGAPTAHRWMMVICCIPMVAIVGLLIVSGTAGHRSRRHARSRK